MNDKNFFRTKHHAMIIRGDFNTHFVRSGFKDAEGNHEWLVFDEDAYELEPWKGGVKRLTTVIIKDTYGVDLSIEVADDTEVIRKAQDRINDILSDERLSYPTANVFSNSPLALIQTQLETELHSMQRLLGVSLTNFKELRGE